MTNVIDFPGKTTRHAPSDVITGESMLNGVSKGILCALIGLAIERENQTIYELFTNKAANEENGRLFREIIKKAESKSTALKSGLDETVVDLAETDQWQAGELSDELGTIVSLNDLDEVLDELVEYERRNGGDGEHHWWKV